MRIVASLEYAGMSDYWGGNGRRWDTDAGCVFAYYGKGTTLSELIDSAADDFSLSGEFDDMAWDDFDSDDVRAALIESLTDQGRRDYENDAVSELALEYAAVNDLDVCRDCGACIGTPHEADCEILAELADSGDIDDNYEVDVCVTDEDCDGDEFSESPVCIFLLELTE